MNQGSAETTRSHVSFDRRARISAVLGGTRIPIGPVVKWIQGSLYQPTALIWGTAVVYGSYAGALLLRFRGDVPPESWQRFVYVVPLIAAGYLLGNLVFGVYRAEWRYSATRDVVGLAIGVTLVTGAVFGINYSSSDRDIPPSVNLISGALILLGTLTLEAATVRGYAGALLARATVFSSPVYRVALGLAALFLLSMAIWIAVRLAGYAPVQIDDSRVQADIFRVLRSNGTWLFEGGLPFLEAFTYASLVKLFGWGVPLVLVPLLFSAALALLLGYVAYRVTGDWWAALAAVLLLPSLPIFLTQARLLPFYPPTMFFGYAGVAAAATYARYGGRWTLAAATLGLAAALYSYNVGIVFLLIPPLYALIDRGRPALVRLGRIYGIVAALATPWLIWHWSLYGPLGLQRQRLWWGAEKGYLEIRNIEFWGIGSSSHLAFLERLPGMVEAAAGPLIFVLLALSIVGLIRLPSWSWRAAVLLALAIPIGALVSKTPAAYTRYIYILLPGLVLLSVYGLHGLLRGLSSRQLTMHLAPAVGMAAIALLGGVFFLNARDELDAVSRLEHDPRAQELADVASLIDDDKSVLGTRSVTLITHRQSNELLAPRFMTEEDFVTYLSWPSDEAVAQMFQRNNIGWILITHPAEVRERDYHVWLKKAAGQLPQHYLRVDESELVERVHEGSRFSLYRVVGAEEFASPASPGAY